MMNFNIQHLLYFLKEQRLHLHAGLNQCCMYFLQFQKSVSVLTSSGKTIQVLGLLSSCHRILLYYEKVVLCQTACMRTIYFYAIYHSGIADLSPSEFQNFVYLKFEAALPSSCIFPAVLVFFNVASCIFFCFL